MCEFAEFLLIKHLSRNYAAFDAPQGNYDDAETLYERSHAIRKAVFGAEHPDVGQSISSLAGVLTHQVRAEKPSEFGEARKLSIRWKYAGKLLVVYLSNIN